jgi:hypothetical protein
MTHQKEQQVTTFIIYHLLLPKSVIFRKNFRKKFLDWALILHKKIIDYLQKRWG